MFHVRSKQETQLCSKWETLECGRALCDLLNAFVGFRPSSLTGSHRLMHWAREFILSMAPGSGIGGEGEASPPPPKPHEVLMAAWEYTIGEKVREAEN